MYYTQVFCYFCKIHIEFKYTIIKGVADDDGYYTSILRVLYWPNSISLQIYTLNNRMSTTKFVFFVQHTEYMLNELIIKFQI